MILSINKAKQVGQVLLYSHRRQSFMLPSAVCRFLYRFGQTNASYILEKKKKRRESRREKEKSVTIHPSIRFVFFSSNSNMTDTRTLSSSSASTTNHVNGTNTTSPLPSDLQNVTGLTNYVCLFFGMFVLFIYCFSHSRWTQFFNKWKRNSSQQVIKYWIEWMN